MSEEMEKVYDRLRETEATNREQNTRIAALTDAISRHNEVVEKCLQENRNTINVFIDHLDRRSARDEKREDSFWRTITILIGSIIALALGPKAAEKIYQACTSPGTAMVSTTDAIPGDERYLHPWFYQRNDDGSVS